MNIMVTLKLIVVVDCMEIGMSIIIDALRDVNIEYAWEKYLIYGDDLITDEGKWKFCCDDGKSNWMDFGCLFKGNGILIECVIL